MYQDHQMRQETDRAKRKLETELQDVKEQLAERKAQLEELQIVLSMYTNDNIKLLLTLKLYHYYFSHKIFTAERRFHF